MSDRMAELALGYWRAAHEWVCFGRHGGRCTSNGFDRECEYPPSEEIAEANKHWLSETDEGFNYLEYGRWDREERIPAWPVDPGTKPRYRKVLS